MPPLAVQAANLVKNTSVLALIAGGRAYVLLELLRRIDQLLTDRCTWWAALLYFIMCFPLSRLALYLEQRTRSHRHLATGDATEELGEDALEVTPGTHDIHRTSRGRYPGRRCEHHAGDGGYSPGSRGAFATTSAARTGRGRRSRRRARADGTGVHRSSGG